MRTLRKDRLPSARRLALLLLAGFGALPGGARAAEPEAVLCPLDFVSGPSVTGGSVTLTSWAVDRAHGAPVPRMEVWLDRSIRGDVRLGGTRPDVASHFGRPDYLLSAWIATISLRGVPAGPHQLEVFAYSFDGARSSCGSRELLVRPFPLPPEPGPWKLELTLLCRALALIGWLTFVGWGPTRIVGRRSVLVSPSIGLCLAAVAIEAGAALGIRPLSTALPLTVASGLVLAISTRRRAIRFRGPSPSTIPIFAISAVFALFGSLPLIRHGAGSILGSINDAVWECSVADSIARYGWTIPKDVHGLLAAVPSVWRAADFRAGVPYPLALLAQVFQVRAHEVHSVLTLATGALVVWATGALARHFFRHLRWLRALATGVAAVNSILFAQFYHQHTGILIAALLYLSFVYCLVALIPARPLEAILPTGILISGAWTLYPETMVLWVLTTALSLVLLSRGLREIARKVIRLAVAAVLAVAINPIGFARTVRFTNALRHASALATADLRTAFGDTHYYPSAAVIAGLRPYRIDWPAPASPIGRPAELLAGGLLLLTAVIGLSRAKARTRRHIVVLLVPVSLWLLMNRLWEFPYGYSKGLPHIVPLWSISLAILLGRNGAGRSVRWRIPLVMATVSLLAILSVRGSADVIGRAIRDVPGYDSAFRTLPDLVKGIDRDAIIVVSEPLNFRREWIAYFLGEYRVVQTPEEARATDGGGHEIFELVDRRSDQRPDRSTPARVSPFFALIRL